MRHRTQLFLLRLLAGVQERAADREAAWAAGVLAAAVEIRAAAWEVGVRAVAWEAVKAQEAARIPEAWAVEWGARKINPPQGAKERVDHSLEAQARQVPRAVRGRRA
ncbi:MAG: hypothetical protein ABI980_06880 [Nitrospirota bacterium]